MPDRKRCVTVWASGPRAPVLHRHHAMRSEFASLSAVHIDDSVTTCDCCGRQNLKATVFMRNAETGAEFHFGRTCAASPTVTSGSLSTPMATSPTSSPTLRLTTRWLASTLTWCCRIRRRHRSSSGSSTALE